MDVIPPARRIRGFTLIELMVTLVVALVLLGVGVPTWRTLVQENALSHARNQMMGALARARYASVNQGRYVTLCPSVDGAFCHRDYRIWHQGYIAFADDNKNRRRDPQEPLLSVYSALPKGIKVQSSPGRRYVRFNPQGATGSNVTLRFCSDVQNKVIIVSTTGRARIADKLPSGGEPQCAG